MYVGVSEWVSDGVLQCAGKPMSLRRKCKPEPKTQRVYGGKIELINSNPI